MKRYTKLYLAFPLLLVTAFLFSSLSANSVSGPIVQLSIEDTIGPATYDYVDRALEAATTRNAELVIIQMDTPGGLDSSMREIIKNIANSTVPIATYVSPTGARAASAGTYILLASHIAAMAPGTNVGAATPVRIGGTSPLSPPKTRKDKPVENGQAEDEEPGDDQTRDDQTGDNTDSIDAGDDAMQKKLINDAVAYIRGLAELHGRNQEWAEKAVRQAASLPASEALKLNVIDIVATDIADLLKQINGREVSVRGHSRTIETTGLPLVQIEPDWRNRLLSVITNPNIAYILMLVGIYGLIFELANPGAIIPGTIGAISLLLAMFAFQLLPVNYAGMGLILLGVLLMVAEAFEPSFGVLGIGGVIAFVIGSIILIDTEAPGFGIDISVIITFAATSVLMFVFVIGMAFKARRRPVVSGLEEMVGGTAVVVEDFEGTGTVTIHSEKWRALSHLPLHKDQQVKVTDIDGLTLTVEPIDTSKEEEQS